jgi:methyl-accepting chemotaxis protein
MKFVSRITPTDIWNENKMSRAQRLLNNRAAILRNLSLTLLILSAPAMLGLIVYWLVSGRFSGTLNFFVNIFACLIFLITFLMAQPGTSARRIEWLSYVIVILLLVFALAYGNLYLMAGALPATFIFVPVVAGFLGLKLRVIYLFTGIAGLGLVVSLLFIKVLPAPQQQAIAEMISWIAVYIIICGGQLFFIRRIGRANDELEERTERMEELLSIMRATNLFSVDLSRNLANTTGWLNEVAQQQTGSVQEQFAAVTQITSSLEELSGTADQIAENSTNALAAADETVTVVTNMRQAGTVVEQRSKQGGEAVTQTVGSVERVRNRIELLGQRLLHLTAQNRKVSAIIDLIDEIAAETHLLALNASIEAAGSVNMDDSGTIVKNRLQGERFGVIAQEIKNLADRSREATEEVRQTIAEMQGAVAAAVLVAEEGKKETTAALSRSQIAGTVMMQLNDVMVAGSLQLEEILAAVSVMRARCEEISLATGQQRSANRQILMTMREFATVAQQNVGTVNQISDAIGGVNGQLDELGGILSKASPQQAALKY